MSEVYSESEIGMRGRKSAADPYDDVTLPAAGVDSPVLGDQDDAPVLLVLACVLLAAVQDAVVVPLGDADKLAVVQLCPHCALVVHLLRCGCDAETKDRGNGKSDLSNACHGKRPE